MVESTIHWREGLGWHGLGCLVGPVHRDAIPILVALSLIAVAVHGAIEHLLEWARRHDDFLPSADDDSFVASLMHPVAEPGKYAGWIAPPRIGIDNRPGDFEYVKLAG